MFKDLEMLLTAHDTQIRIMRSHMRNIKLGKLLNITSYDLFFKKGQVRTSFHTNIFAFRNVIRS